MNAPRPPRLHSVPGPVPHTADPACPDLDEIFRNYSGYVATIAFRILGNDGDVDDVVQDVFLDALRGLKRLREPGALKGWLATVTVRCATRRLRARRLRAFLGLDDLPRYEEVASADATPEQRAMLASVYRVLDGVPLKDRVAWTLRTLEEQTLDDVARLCGCSLATVKRRVTAAQRAIERRLGHD
jgi:RNA polymerase sigma-70 factor, ECF subfamily